jgi:hypothetical protein
MLSPMIAAALATAKISHGLRRCVVPAYVPAAIRAVSPGSGTPRLSAAMSAKSTQ